MDQNTFRQYLRKGLTRKPKTTKVDWEEIYKKALAAGKILSTKAFHKEIVEEKVNSGRAKAKLHEWADEEEPKVARLWTSIGYRWSFDPEDIAVYKERVK